MKLARSFCWSAFALLGLTGCPLTDDYFIDGGQPLEADSQSGSGGAPTPDGPSVTSGGASSPAGGGPEGLVGGTLLGGAASGEAAACVGRAERCNGRDDNCNGMLDEAACDSALGCVGFTLSLDVEHGYMFCSGHKNWTQAQSACAAQDMRLASLETSAEGSDFAQALQALATDDVWFGANDQGVEGEWVWDGGSQFWQGNQAGAPVAGAFVAWASASPDNSNNGEDCAIINPNTGLWADRSCAGNHAYVCEETTP